MSHTVTGLEESAAYQVRVRARYYDGNDNLTESGPWSDPPVELTVSATPPPKKGTNAREGDSNQGHSTNPPAKPTGITYGASYNNVLLFWADPGDDSITGYQVLRGPDAANLAVLTDDTGSASASYSDDTVSAKTTYAYAILARNAEGLSPQSDPISVTTGPAPVEPESDLAVAGAEFTLDGQMLDTTGTCSESDIAAISDDCTLDIFDATVPLTIDGTLSLSPGQVLVFQIARDSSGVVSARQAATQADFPNDGDSKDITFPAGRNLLRANHAGTDQHYFGVNVLPYWELERPTAVKGQRVPGGNRPQPGRHHRCGLYPHQFQGRQSPVPQRDSRAVQCVRVSERRQNNRRAQHHHLGRAVHGDPRGRRKFAQNQARRQGGAAYRRGLRLRLVLL